MKEVLTPETGNNPPYYSLSDLRTFRAWDFSWPTLTRPRRFTGRHNYASDAAFFNTIQNHNHGVSHDLLNAVGAFDYDNEVVLHGGALTDLVTQREDEIKDWDLRLVGEKYVDSNEACVEAAKQFVDKVYSWIRHENDRIQTRIQIKDSKYKNDEPFDFQKVITSRSKSTLTIVVPGRRSTAGWIQETVLQFTFAPYKTVHELLEHSTPHCTRLAVKDYKVILDRAGCDLAWQLEKSDRLSQRLTRLTGQSCFYMFYLHTLR